MLNLLLLALAGWIAIQLIFFVLGFVGTLIEKLVENKL